MAAGAVAAYVMAGCDSLSDQEKRMVGDYYIPEVSDSTPLYELSEDRSAVVRTIADGVEASVRGKWRVDNDSLIIDIDESTLTMSDPQAVKVKMQPHIALPIVSYNEITLSLRKSDGLQYDYHRRFHKPDNESEE